MTSPDEPVGVVVGAAPARGLDLDRRLRTRLPPVRLPPALVNVPEPVGDTSRLPYMYVGQAARRISSPYARRGPFEVLPGIRSTDAEYVGVLRRFATEVERMDPPRINSFGFADERGITGDLSALRCRSGLLMSAMHTPPPLILRDIDVPAGFASPIDRLIFEVTHERMFRRRVKGTSYHASRVSSTSSPFMLYDPAEKQWLAEVVLNDTEGALNAAHRGDAKYLYNELNWLDVMHAVTRYQGENPDKPRKVTIPVPSGGKLQWAEITADKYRMGQMLGHSGPWMGGQRVRTAWGYAGVPTVFTSCMVASIREFYLNEYAFTWKHRGPEDIYRKLEGATAILGVDVSNMDQNYKPFLLESFAQGFGRYHDERWVSVLQRQIRAPYFAPQPGIGLPPVMVGDAFARDNNYRIGLPSGMGLNPDAGRYGAYGAYLCLLHKLFGVFPADEAGVRRVWDQITMGLHPEFAMLNSSDDNVFIFRGPNGPANREKLLAALVASEKGTPISPYFPIGPEKGTKFLGWVLRMSHTGAMLLPTPDPLSLWKNLCVPEQPIGSKHRPHWDWGLTARFEHYAQAGSVISDHHKVFQDCWRLGYGSAVPHPLAMARRSIAIAPPRIDIMGLDPISASVLERPELLHYRYSASEVDDLVLRMLTTTIPGDRIERALGHTLAG